MYVFGYDPVFLDIIVLPKDKDDNLMSELPFTGEHVPNTDVKFIPGGNGLNVAKIFSKLTTEVIYFVGNYNDSFKDLLQKDYHNLMPVIDKYQEPNHTIILQLQSTEVQLNSVKSGFNGSSLSPVSILLLLNSKIIPFSNLGLNTDGKELFDSLIHILTSYQSIIKNYSVFKSFDTFQNHLSHFMEEITDRNFSQLDKFEISLINELHSKAISKRIHPIIYYFDPSTLNNFNHWKWLQRFFKNYLNLLNGFKIISLNEHEYKSCLENNINFSELLTDQAFLIVHDQFNVKISSSTDNELIVDVPKISTNIIKNTVGAGDAFNAGLLFNFSKTFNIKLAVEEAIRVAQDFITGNL